MHACTSIPRNKQFARGYLHKNVTPSQSIYLAQQHMHITVGFIGLVGDESVMLHRPTTLLTSGCQLLASSDLLRYVHTPIRSFVQFQRIIYTHLDGIELLSNLWRPVKLIALLSSWVTGFTKRRGECFVTLVTLLICNLFS